MKAHYQSIYIYIADKLHSYSFKCFHRERAKCSRALKRVGEESVRVVSTSTGHASRNTEVSTDSLRTCSIECVRKYHKWPTTDRSTNRLLQREGQKWESQRGAPEVSHRWYSEWLLSSERGAQSMTREWLVQLFPLHCHLEKTQQHTQHQPETGERYCEKTWENSWMKRETIAINCVKHLILTWKSH